MTSMEMIASQYALHNRLFKNVLENMGNDRETRPSEATNHMAWLAGHLVSTRYTLVNILGGSAEEPHADVFGSGKGIDESLAYPSLEASIVDWNTVTPLLMEALDNFDASKLNENAPFPLPTGQKLGEALSFFAHHEAYHIGQIGILRKYFGKDAMKYN